MKCKAAVPNRQFGFAHIDLQINIQRRITALNVSLKAYLCLKCTFFDHSRTAVLHLHL